MRIGFQLLGTIGVVWLLGGCVQPTEYGPLGDQGGFAEQRIEDNRFKLRFVGNSLTPRDRVETFLLYRAAELTLQAGHAGFRIVERSTEPVTAFYSVDHGLFDRSRDRAGYTGLDLNSRIDMVTPVTRYEAFAEILMVDPPFEPGGGRAYNARQVVDNLGPVVRLSRPPEDPTE